MLANCQTCGMQLLASPLNEPQINKNETSGWLPFAVIDVRTSAPSIIDMILCLCGGLEIESTATLLRSSLQIQQMLSACRYELLSQHFQPLTCQPYRVEAMTRNVPPPPGREWSSALSARY
jgi:hypothetical protein